MIYLAATWLLILMFTANMHAAGVDGRLADAVKKGQTETVTALLAQRVDVNSSEADGTTALQYAVRNQDLAMTELLIRSGAQVNASNQYGVTPLWLACIGGSVDIVEQLINAGADVERVSVGETPLMAAARSGHTNVVKRLAGHGAKVDTPEHVFGQTPLMIAAAEEHADVAKVLTEIGASVHARSSSRWSPILFAVRSGDLETVRVLLDAGANVNDATPGPENAGTYARAGGPGPTSALEVAILNAHYELAKFLLERGADPNVATSGRTPLHEVIQAHHLEGLDLIALTPRGSLDYLGLLRVLLAHGANPNARMTRSLHAALTQGTGTQFFPWTVVGATPFWFAARAADLAAMRLLLDHGADPLIATEENTTPLMVAAGLGYSDGQTPGTERDGLAAVKLLVELGADVNSVQATGEACVPASFSDVGATGRGSLNGRVCGWTALHGAAARGATTIVQFLVDHGANLFARDKLGQTPLEVAQGKNVAYAASVYIRDDTAALLEKLMARAKPRN